MLNFVAGQLAPLPHLARAVGRAALAYVYWYTCVTGTHVYWYAFFVGRAAPTHVYWYTLIIN